MNKLKKVDAKLYVLEIHKTLCLQSLILNVINNILLKDCKA
jgi:hypothetical protein